MDDGRTDLRPRPILRVGIVGHRSFPDGGVADIAVTARRVMSDIARAVSRLVSEMPGHNAEAPPLLQLVSPLAEGADRIGAHAARALKWQLMAPLPFRQDIYENDFPGTVGEFRELLAVARDSGGVVELDSARESAERAYLAVGRFVLRNCDLLLAIWNGAPARGTGGTAEIVAEAGAIGLPVLQIVAATPYYVKLYPNGDLAQAHDFTFDRLSNTIRPLLNR